MFLINDGEKGMLEKTRKKQRTSDLYERDRSQTVVLPAEPQVFFVGMYVCVNFCGFRVETYLMTHSLNRTPPGLW